MGKIGFIGGTGVADSLVEDPSVVFINRHGKKYCAPHNIDAQRNLLTMKNQGVDQIIAVATVGAINPKFKPGDLALLTDFIDFTRGRAECLEPLRFTDVSEPYDPGLRQKILAAARALKIKVHPEAIYVCTEGPRFETKAEIRMYGKMGADVVGMTQVPEVVLAAELGIRYVAIAVVTNFAAGVAPQPIDAEHVAAVMRERKPDLARLLAEVIRAL